MSEVAEFLARSIAIGAGATALMDLWTLARKHLFRGASADYRLVGRWIGHLFHGRLRHRPIANSPPVPGELAIGWVSHYCIGIAFAAVLLGIHGRAWAEAPTLWPALIVGMGTVAAPFLIMQPAMGGGFAASRAPRPSAARLQSVVTHAVFGLGLYVSAWLMRA